jgi:predicted DNA-binding WGR domain protein
MEKKESNIELNYHWGSCNTRRGGKKELVLTESEAIKAIEKMIKRRRSRGYELVTS